MPLAYTVPESVKKSAARALNLHAKSPLPDTVGMSVAEALVAGVALLDTIARMQRFFTVNSKAVLDETMQLRTEEDSALLRSWLMYGAESGKAWVAEHYNKAVKDGLLLEDPLLELFVLPPEEVYPRLSLGAWRFEFNLTPSKAAKFVEDYQRATGFILELRQAFGPAAEAVGNAIYRRYHTPNPFSEVVKALMIEDDEYRIAAHQDLAELNFSIAPEHRLDEALFPKVGNLSPVQAAKMVWAPFVAYFILAVEKAELLADYNKISVKPPLSDDKIKSYTVYNDIVSTAIMYFHPEGKHFHDPINDKQFAGIDFEILQTLLKVWLGKPIFGPATKKMLGRARRWTAQHKLAGSLFHVFNADWNKANWQHILDNIPLDHDIRPYFEQFVKEDPLPAEGVKLQQTLSDKIQKEQVANFIGKNFNATLVTPVPVKVADTQSAALAASKGTPIGVYSLLKHKTTGEYVILGAWKIGNSTYFILKKKNNAEFESLEDNALWAYLNDGTVKVVQAHYSMPGTKYDDDATPAAPPAPTVKQDPTPTIQEPSKPAPSLLSLPKDKAEMLAVPTSTEIEDFLFDEFGGHFDQFVGVPLTQTLTGAAAAKFLGAPLASNTMVQKVKGADAGSFFRILRAFQIPNVEVELTDEETGEKTTEVLDDTIILFRTDDGDLNWLSDETVAKVIERGVIKYADTKAAYTDNADGTPAEPTQPEPSSEPEPDKFAVGDILQYELALNKYLVVGKSSENYAMQLLTPSSSKAGGPTHVEKDFAHANYTVVGGWDGTPVHAYKHATASGPTHPLPLSKYPDTWKVKEGEAVETYVGVGTFVGAASWNSKIVPVIGHLVSGTILNKPATWPLFITIAADTFEQAAPVSSYNPTALKPEPGAEDALDTPDVEAKPEMCGTPEAISKLDKIGNTPATKSENKEFMWDLGDVLAYGKESSKQRTIIGYSFSPTGVPQYIIKTETGALNFKTTKEGNKSYGPKLHSDPAVIVALVPKPDADTFKFPKLNYKLSDWAKTYAKEFGVTFIPSPKGAAFYVGTNLTNKNTGEKYKLQAWFEHEGSKTPRAILSKAPTGATSVTETFDQLGMYYEIAYQHGTVCNFSTGEFVQGKGAGDGALTVYMKDAPQIPSTLPEGWDDPTAVKQPTIGDDLGSRHLSAGIVAIIPSGSMVSDGNLSKLVPAHLAVMVHPMNEYGGYKLTFPKGTVEKGESIEKAAVRECWEETGLAIKPVAYLGDYKGNSSVTRMFIGHVIGGNAYKAGKETDAVAYKPLSLSADVIDESWAKDLQERDKKILLDVKKWILANGTPNHNAVDKADAPAQVTNTVDTVSPSDEGPVLFKPGVLHMHEPKFTKQNKSQIDYFPKADAEAWIGKLLQELGNCHEWQWKDATPSVNMGYPPPGVLVMSPNIGTEDPFFVEGYTFRESTNVSGVKVTYVSMIGRWQKKTLKQFLRIDLTKVTYNPGQHANIETLYAGEEFHPVVHKSVATTIKADTAEDDLWEQLFKKLPFPVTTDMVSAIKSHADEKGVTPVKFDAAKAAVGGPQYGTVFQTPDGDSFMAMGHLTLLLNDGGMLSLQLSFDIQGMPEIHAGDQAALKKYKPDAGGASHFAATEPWFTHPDPATNKIIQMVYANGGNLDAVGVKMKEFKEKWLKEAGVPYYAVASYTILQDICSLFVPGVASKFQYDAVIGCLKKRMALTQKKGKAAGTKSVDTVLKPPSPPVYTTPTPTAPTAFPKPAAPVKAEPITYDSVFVKDIVAKPDPSQFQKTGKSMGGGSKPNMILQGPNGSKWFFKMGLSGEGDFRAYTDEAASKFAALVKANTVPVGVLTLDGKTGSLQPIIEGASPLADGDYVHFSAEDMAEVLSQHTVDMFIGNHDGHAGNWMRDASGKLVEIDLGQAFKFILKGTKESLDPTWKAPGNFGQPVAKALLIAWAKKEVEIAPGAFKAMKLAIDKVQKITNTQLESIVESMAEGAGYTTQTNTLIEALKKRRDDYLKNWTTVMEKLAKMRGDDWTWPTFGAVTISATVLQPKKAKKTGAPEAPAFDVSAEEMYLNEREQKVIAETNELAWMGKTLKIDRDAIENQDVMIRRVIYGKSGVGTMIHFRVAAPAAKAAVSRLDDVSKTVQSTEGPQPLSIDETEGYWKKLRAGIGHVNYHLFNTPDGLFKPEKIDPVKELIPVLKELEKNTSKPGKTAGYPNEVVNQMANLYIQYAENILDLVANAKNLLGQKADIIHQFKYEAPKGTDEEPPTSSAVKVLKQMSPKKLNTNIVGNMISVQEFDTSFDAQGFSSGYQYHIEVPSVPGARIYFMPPGVTPGYAGQAFGVIPGEPSPATVALMLKAFMEATGIDMKAASKLDREFLYWSRQAALLQPAGTHSGMYSDVSHSVKTVDGTLASDPAYVSILSTYKNGNVEEALSSIKNYVASRLSAVGIGGEKKKVTVADLNKMVKPSDIEGSYSKHPKADGSVEEKGGFHRHFRLGWTRESLSKFFNSTPSKPVWIGHQMYGAGITKGLTSIINHNGALVAMVLKPMYGVNIISGHSGSDPNKGGGHSLYTCIRRGPNARVNHLYFDISILLRVDAEIFDKSDSYGNPTYPRLVTPEAWKAHGLPDNTSEKPDAECTAGSSYQLNLRHDIDLREYLVKAVLPSASDAKEIIALVKEVWGSGVRFSPLGLKPEDVFVSKG